MCLLKSNRLSVLLVVILHLAEPVCSCQVVAAMIALLLCHTSLLGHSPPPTPTLLPMLLLCVAALPPVRVPKVCDVRCCAQRCCASILTQNVMFPIQLYVPYVCLHGLHRQTTLSADSAQDGVFRRVFCFSCVFFFVVHIWQTQPGNGCRNESIK